MWHLSFLWFHVLFERIKKALVRLGWRAGSPERFADNPFQMDRLFEVGTTNFTASSMLNIIGVHTRNSENISLCPQFKIGAFRSFFWGFSCCSSCLNTHLDLYITWNNIPCYIRAPKLLELVIMDSILIEFVFHQDWLASVHATV